ncbi:MAG: LacI family DNA-binding transcriptional regulator [Bacteroidota bacterium]
MMKTATTLHELAKRLNLSTATVSRALKDHPNIAPDTKARVLKLADELDYEPNAYAVSLRTSSSKEFGIIVPTLTGFFNDSLISSIQEGCRKEGYSVLIFVSDNDPEAELSCLKICKQRQVDGIFISITSNTSDLEPFQKLNRLGTPVVFVDRVPTSSTDHKVCFEDETLARFSAQYIINKGKQNVLALFGHHQLSISQKRLKAFEEEFANAGRSQNLTIRNTQGNEAAAERVLQDLKSSNNYDTIFCMTDEILIGAMKSLQTLGLRAPKDIGILCMSNGFFPKLYQPEITYVETSGVQLGQLALNHMFSILNNEEVPKASNLPPQIIEGGSI